MSGQTQQRVPMVSVSQAHVAFLISDTPASGATPGAVVYSTPTAVTGLVKAGFKGGSKSEIYWADGIAYATVAQLGDMAVDLQCPDLLPAERAAWFGQQYENGVLLEGQINPKYMAFGYCIEKLGGGKRYMWFLKTKPSLPDESNETRKASASFQDVSLSLAASMRMSDGYYRRMVDDDDPNLPVGVTPELIAENWFTSPDWVPETPEA